jgi:NADH:ubiquinone oxidoreductase subunit K
LILELFLTNSGVILSSFIISIGLLGLILNRNILPSYLVSFETITLGVLFLLFTMSLYYNCNELPSFTLALLSMAAVEISTGLILMSKFYRTEHSLNYNQVIR